jgi:hypothetical protein
MLGTILGIGGAALGALAGSQGQQSSQSYSRQLGPASELERRSGTIMTDSMNQFSDLVGAGPGQKQVQAGLKSQEDLASFLQQMFSNGGLPTQQQMGFANQLTNDVFAPEQMALQQRFQDAQVFGNRQAAKMGRGGADPILMNKLLQEQTRQQQMLGSQMTSFRAQQAQLMPQQQLGFAQQLAQVNSGLASQALANRQALLNMGSQIRNQEQNFRLNTGTSTQSTSSGGGLMGALSGGLAMAGGMASAMPGLQSMFGFGSTPVAPTGADLIAQGRAGSAPIGPWAQR